MMAYRIGATIFVLAVCLVGAASLRAITPKDQVVASERAPTIVQVQAILPQQLTLQVRTQGSVLPAVESELVAEVSGRIIETAPSLVVGGAFRTGDVLLKLDDTQARQQVQQANAQLARSNAELRHARFERQRAAKLEEQRLTSRAGLENADRLLKVAKANQADAAARLARAKQDLARTEIVAPYDGRVRHENVDVGQFLSRGAKIATLFAESAVEVRLPIHNRELAFLDPSVIQQGHLDPASRPVVTLSAEYGGQDLTWTGEVVRRDAQIDSISRMVHLIARVPSGDGTLPLPVGLFVDAVIEGVSLDSAIVLPRIAVRDSGHVLIVDSDNRLRFRNVDALRLDADRVLVREGLSAGERVCISPIATPVEGMYVSPMIAHAG